MENSILSPFFVDMHLQRMLAQHGQLDAGASAKVMEINAAHGVVKKLAAIAASDADTLGEAALLLLDQARIVEGEPLSDAVAFGKRLTTMMEKGLV